MLQRRCVMAFWSSGGTPIPFPMRRLGSDDAFRSVARTRSCRHDSHNPHLSWSLRVLQLTVAHPQCDLIPPSQSHDGVSRAPCNVPSPTTCHLKAGRRPLPVVLVPPPRTHARLSEGSTTSCGLRRATRVRGLVEYRLSRLVEMKKRKVLAEADCGRRSRPFRT